MKDSIGSSVIIQIFLVFIIIFIVFMACIINYTKTFRIKNQVINIIDRYEGYTADAKSEVESYFTKQKAAGACVEINDATPKYQGDKCNVARYDVTGGGYYYKVIVYIEVTLPLIEKPITIPVTGETKVFREISEGNTDKVTYIINYKEYVLPKIDMDLSVKPAPVDPPSGGGGGGSCGTCPHIFFSNAEECGISEIACRVCTGGYYSYYREGIKVTQCRKWGGWTTCNTKNSCIKQISAKLGSDSYIVGDCTVYETWCENKFGDVCNFKSRTVCP